MLNQEKKAKKQYTQINVTRMRVSSAYHQSIVHTSYNYEINKGNNVRNHHESYMLVVKHNFTTTKKRNEDINNIA